jgi:FG-GAP-like repeat
MRSVLVAAALGATLVVAGLVSPVISSANITFTPEAAPVLSFTPGDQAFGAAVGDINADGRPDVGLVYGNSDKADVYTRNAGASFTQVSGAPFTTPGGPSGIVFADFNKDGRVDIAVAKYIAESVQFFMRQSNGTYTGGGGWDAAGIGGLAVGDFNGDTWPDIATVDYNGGNLSIMRSNQSTGNPTFTYEGPYPAGANSRNVAVGDFNNDNKLDAAVPNNGTNTVSVFLRNAANNGMNAATNIIVAPAAPAPSPSGIAVADFNNDGNQDFAVSLFGINKVATYLGQGTGAFSVDTGSPVDFGAGTNPNGLGVGDFDLDGRRDLAVTQDTGDAVTILRRNTNLQGFTKESPNPITSANGVNGPVAVGIADFDGDTRPDLAVTSRDNATMRFFKNTTTIPAPINTARPQVSGTPQVGAQLTCSPGTWEGNPTQPFTYVWDRAPRATTDPNDPAWAQINGASGTTYTVQAADAGSRVRCRVGAVNGFGSGEAKSDSRRTDSGPPVNTRAPATTGTPVTGQTLTCDPGDWANAPDFTYAWNRGGNLIPGETGRTLTLTDTDVRIACEVTATNELGSVSIRAPGLHVVAAPPNNFLRPTVSVNGSNTRPVGRVATCDPGAWTFNDFNYVYAWDRNGSEIGGATGKTYTTTSADLGVEIRCRVKSINPAGESGFVASNSVELKLPPGTERSSIFRSDPTNEFDPVNIGAVSADYKAAVSLVVTGRLKAAVAKETEKCRGRRDLPAKAPVLTRKDFPLTEAPRCAVLVRAPNLVDVGGFGVQYLAYAAGKGRAAQEAPCQRPGTGTCPDMGFAIDPVDPEKPGTLTEAELNILEGATPERVLWDLDKDGITDVDCPASAPVMRTLPEKGEYDVRAVIVTKDSAVTNVFGSATQTYRHFDASPGKLRPTQAFVCRTSLEPPPNPDVGPCLTKGTIARVSITGNFCPVYLRALDPNVIAGLPKDVYDLLKGMSDGLALGDHKRKDAKVHVPVTTPSIWRAASGSVADKSATATFVNMASSIISVPNVKDLLLAPSGGRLSAKKLVDVFAKPENFLVKRANFALDQIYWAKGAVTVNGVTVDPLRSLPTLLVPTEAQEALTTVKTMIINTPAAQLGLNCVKPSKPLSFEDCGLPLDADTPINATLKEAKTAGVAFLKDTAGEAADQLNLDQLSAELRAKIDQLTKPFTIVGDADVKLEKDGTATVTAAAEIPVLKDEQGKGMRLQITLNGDLEGNIKLKGIRLGPVGAKLGGVNLSGVVVQYDDAGLAVAGQLLFPPVNQGIELKTFKITKEGKFGGLALDYLAGSGQGIPIGAVPGTYLTKLGGGVPNLENPFEIEVNAAVSAGPSAGGGCPTAGVDGTLNAKFGARNKPAFVGTFHANVVVMCLALGSVDVYVDSSPYFSVEGRAGIDVGPLKVQGDVKAAVDPNRAWQLTANASLTLKDLPVVGDVGPIGGSFALSNRGVAGCVIVEIDFLPDFKGGLGVRFPGGVPPLNIPAFLANLDPFLGCDLSDYKPLGRRVYAKGAQAGVNEFTLPKDTTSGLLSIEGAGGAPRVKLTSPSGKVFDYTNATAPVRLPPTQGQIDEARDRTFVFFGRAEAGKWTVTPAAGSPTISRIRVKRILPKPKVSGKVGGKGTSRTLTYNITPIDGQEVRFMEEAGGLAKSLKTVKGGGRGTFRYTIGEATTSKRTIVAQVIQDDLPRENITVASYTAANPKVGRPGRLKVTRKGSKATVTWRKATLGVTYEVSVKNATRGNTNLLFPPKGKTTVVVPNVGAKDKLTVSVVAVSRGGRKGPVGRATLNPPKSKKKGKKKK